MGEGFELMYVYIDDIGRTFIDQEICFTNDYSISYENKNLILKKKYNPYYDLWGSHISSINLLIGKNGSGKTTLLELLGSERKKRRSYEVFSKLSWFALYRKGEDEFIIEGNGKSLIKNIKTTIDIDDEYGLTFNYDYNGNCFYNMGFVQDISKELVYLYYPDTTMYSWCNEKSVYEDDNTSFSFCRNKLYTPDYDNIYTFVCKEIKFLNQNTEQKNELSQKIPSIPNLKCKIGLKANSGGYDISIRNMNRKSYSNKQIFMLHIMLSFITERISRIGLDNQKNSYQEQKEQLIEMYENAKNVTDEEIDEFNELINIAEKLNENYFIHKNHRDSFYKYVKKEASFVVDVEEQFDENVYEFLRKIKSKRYLLSKFHIKFDDLSVGEMEFINLFSNLYDGIRKSIKSDNKNMILLLDEPGKGFHPELTRRFVNYLYNFSSYLGNKYNCKFQYLITTHSPFMISDIPKNNIKRFLKNYKDDLCKIEMSTKGLMSNIHDIMKDDFHVQSPIGCFAESVFTKLQEEIMEISDIKEDGEKIKRIRYIINDIDEIILSSKLNEVLEEHINLITYNNPKQRNYLIKQLEKELERLKGLEENDI